jgi:hypothetical protein
MTSDLHETSGLRTSSVLLYGVGRRLCPGPTRPHVIRVAFIVGNVFVVGKCTQTCISISLMSGYAESRVPAKLKLVTFGHGHLDMQADLQHVVT